MKKKKTKKSVIPEIATKALLGSSKTSENNKKDSNSINFGETTSTETGDQLSQTFSEIAQQYRTEIKVNPQSMIIIFY